MAARAILRIAERRIAPRASERIISREMQPTDQSGTLALNFTALNLDAASEAFVLTVAQASGTTMDTISGLTTSAVALPGTINLPGIIVSDFHFVISGSGS
jgi:hypothetical protein